MPQIRIMWHAIIDNNTCLICKALNGYQWVFESGKDFMTDSLWHPTFGQVWSLSLGSNAHGHHWQSFNCRCHIEVEFYFEDVLAKCVFLREQAQAASEPYIPWRGGGLFAEH